MKKVSIFIFLLLMCVPTCAWAKTLNDYYNELAKLQAEYNNNKKNQNLTEEQILQINNEIGELNVSISNTREEIKKTEEEIENSKLKIEDKKVETDGLIQFLQISNGGNIYLEYLFDAENYTDFIYRYEVVKQLSRYNNDLITELEELIIDLNNKEKELEEKNEKLTKDRNQLGTKLVTLQSNVSTYKVEGTEIQKDIEDLQKIIKAYEDRGCERDLDVEVCKATINATGWYYPLKKGCVTSEFTGAAERPDAYGGSHYAIDLGCASEGTPIYPAADGIVERVVIKSSCGGNAIYMSHVVNGKKYTTVYMHLLKFANGINGSTNNMVVTKDTVIGYVGGYSTSSKRGGYDDCTTGAHLHFGIAEGHNYSSSYYYNINAINPREIFSFPKIGGGYFYR